MPVNAVRGALEGAVRFDEPFIKVQGDVAQLVSNPQYRQPVALHRQVTDPVHTLVQNRVPRDDVDLSRRRAQIKYAGAGGGFKDDRWHSSDASWPGQGPVIDTKRRMDYVDAFKKEFDLSSFKVIGEAALETAGWAPWALGMVGVIRPTPSQLGQRALNKSDSVLPWASRFPRGYTQDNAQTHVDHALARVLGVKKIQFWDRAFLESDVNAKIQVGNRLLEQSAASKRRMHSIGQQITAIFGRTHNTTHYIRNTEGAANTALEAARMMPDHSTRAQIHATLSRALAEDKQLGFGAHPDRVLRALSANKANLQPNAQAFVDKLFELLSFASGADKFYSDGNVAGAGQPKVVSSSRNRVLEVLDSLGNSNVSQAQLSSLFVGLGRDHRSEVQRMRVAFNQDQTRMHDLQKRELRIQEIQEELDLAIKMVSK